MGFVSHTNGRVPAAYYWPCNVNCTPGAAGIPPGDNCSRFCDANNNFCQYTFCRSNCTCAWCNNSTDCTNPKWGTGDCTCQACNMSTGLPWTAHTGYDYPGAGSYDRASSDALFNAVVPLTLAWWFTQHASYGARAAVLLRHWFLEPATAMNPNLDFADTIPGVGPETGGTVDFVSMLRQWRQACSVGPAPSDVSDVLCTVQARFPRVLDCVRLLEAGDEAKQFWTAADRRAMRDWVGKLLKWWLHSRPGAAIMARFGNIAQTSAITALSMALYTEQQGTALAIARAQAERHISQQVDASGHVFRDMKRPDGFM